MKKKSRTGTAKVIGPIPYSGIMGMAWKVRMKVPYLPFYLDSGMCFRKLAQAEEFAKKWERKTVVVTITG